MRKQYRLRQKDIDAVFKKGKTVQNGFFFVKFLKNSQGGIKYAVIVPKNVSKKSVERHAIQRKIREAFPINTLFTVPFHLVFVALPPIVRKGFSEIKSSMDQSIKNIFV